MLSLSLGALVEQGACATMFGYEISMRMALAPHSVGHCLNGLKLLVVSARSFVDPPYIHQEIQVVVECQVKLSDVGPSVDAVYASILIQSDKCPSREVKVALQPLDSSKLFVAIFTERANQA